MRKFQFTVVIVSVFLMMSLLFVAGCAKKATVVQPSEETQVVPSQQAAGESDAEKAAREKALKEAELREQERLQAERDKAALDKAAAAAAAVSPLTGAEFIYFDYDKYAVKTESRDTLKKIADKLTAKPGLKIVIEGNCDERGTVEYNLALGERRANAAMKYLVTLGIDSGRIATLSNGKEKPVDPGHTEESWAKNRNAHFLIKK